MGDPKATSKHTLCGYAWGDVSSSLQKAIGVSDMTRAQRWAAELVCSELGLGRLEAILFHSWGLHVGSMLPGWCRNWLHATKQLRELWSKSGGDIKAVRNTPIVRQLVCEAVANLVLATKHPLPSLPTPADCFREADAMRARIRSGSTVGDQYVVRRIWTAQADGDDLRTIGNELESAIRTNQHQRTLFWIIWLFTLDTQEGAPTAKERGPLTVSIKQRKSILWYLIALLRELANDSAYLSLDDRTGMFELLELTWPKLGSKGRRDCVVSIALAIQEHIAKKNSLVLTTNKIPDSNTIRTVISRIDSIYSGIADEAKKYMLETPVIVGLTKESQAKINENKVTKLSAIDKLSLSYSLFAK